MTRLIGITTGLLFAVVLSACGGGGGNNNNNSTSPPQEVSLLSGTVTNSETGAGVAGATVALDSTATGKIVLTTAADGTYTAGSDVVAGTYTMTVSADGYNDSTQQVEVTDTPKVVDVKLEPATNVSISIDYSGPVEPGATVTATARYIIPSGSELISAQWEPVTDSEGNPEGVAPKESNPNGTTLTMTLASASDYAAYLVHVLKNPPITAADLPPDLNLQPINQIEKGMQNRNQAVAIDPMALERAEEVPWRFTVVTTSSDPENPNTQTQQVIVTLPWVVNTGVRTVPVGVPVLLYAKDGANYHWEITQKPAGSNATLTGADTQTPWFTPDVVTNATATPAYQIQEMNGSGANLEIHVGRYFGVIDPLATLDSVNFGDGRPVAESTCTGCHRVGGAAPANFDLWRNTGHAEAFTQGITTNGHFGASCFGCHAVGYDRDNAGGIDDTPNYKNFLTSLANLQSTGMIADAWTMMLEDYPDTARKSNIQCENCHGPQSYTSAHPYDSDLSVDSRVKLGSEVCGSCHGEPARHGRYQQWLLSNHADYDLAVERGSSSGNCARCHSGNGFVAWNEFEFNPADEVDATAWNEDTVVPQTCAACHNPHDTGTTSGSTDTNAKVRIMGDTNILLAGFQATNVGRGATCMTCHNSRGGVQVDTSVDPTGWIGRNDATWDLLSDSQKTGGPHHGVQADLIMGQNAYFFTTGELVRGKHSLLPDTCIVCHMEKTLPPDILSYNQSGTNHTFAADPNICSDCHGSGGITADSIDTIITTDMAELETALGAGYMRVLAAHYPVEAAVDDVVCATADVGNPITAVTWNYGGHSGATLDITVQDGSSCTGSGLSDITVDGGPQTLLEAVLDPANGAEALLKARWNYGLLFEDETINECPDEGQPGYDPNCTPPHTARGVHNPDFGTKALTRATDAVKAVPVSAP